jgi:hypothetical protein
MAKGSKGNGIGIVGLLGVAFVVLKLCHVIDWSGKIQEILAGCVFIRICIE